MALTTPRDLFLLEIGEMRDMERTGGNLLSAFADRACNSELKDSLLTQRQGVQQQLANLTLCLDVLGASPLEVTSDAMESIRRGFQQFTRLQPVPEVLDMFVIDAVRRFTHFAIAGYRGLVCWTALVGERKCARPLLANLVAKEEVAGSIERIGFTLGDQVLATATTAAG